MAQTTYSDPHLSLLLKPCPTVTRAKNWIGCLPDDLLLNILSRLTLKEAMQTSIVSRRWKTLWASHPILDFGCFNSLRLYSYTYVQRVANILRRFNGCKMHKFRILYPLSRDFGPFIDDWIFFALKNGVSEIDLDFDGSRNYYIVSTSVFCFLTTSPNLVKHFGTVRVLCLRHVNLTNETFDQILCSCVCLEKLLISQFWGLVNAKNKAPHMKLKSLELYYCGDLESLELWTPNLVSFKYHGRERTLCFKDAQNITSLWLLTFTTSDYNTSSKPLSRKDFVFSQFSYLHKLKFLNLSVHLLEDMGDFAELHVFSNLRHLMLDVADARFDRLCYHVATFFLRVSPYLEQLEIRIPIPASRSFIIKNLNLASMSPHQNLKEVKLFGFIGHPNTMEFLIYLLRYVVSLQKIDISTHEAIWHGDEHIILNSYLKADDAKLGKRSVEKLRQTLPQNIQLIYRNYERCLKCITYSGSSVKGLIVEQNN